MLSWNTDKRKISDHVVNRLSGAGRGLGMKASLAPAEFEDVVTRLHVCVCVCELSTFFNRSIPRNKSKACTNQYVTMEVQFLLWNQLRTWECSSSHTLDPLFKTLHLNTGTVSDSWIT